MTKSVVLKKNDEIRVLVISVNSFSKTNNNGKTIASFFKDFKEENIAQLYLYPEYPDGAIKCDYFNITESNLIKKFFGNNITNEVKYVESNQVLSSRTNSLYNFNIKNMQFLRFLRDTLWTTNLWESEELFNWIENFKPDCIFYSGLNNYGMIKMVRKIADKYKLPVVVYATDDYFLPVFSLSVFRAIRRRLLVNEMKKLLSGHSKLVVINEYMKETYDVLFSQDCDILVNLSVPNSLGSQAVIIREKIKLSYFGNLNWNRDKVIGKLAKWLDKSSLKDVFEIEVYSSSPKKRQIENITVGNVCSYKGFLNSEQLYSKMNESDVLLFAESFDYYSRVGTKLSLSTKITEYLYLNRPILAIGPKDIGSIRFLQDNTDNVIINTLEDKEIYEKLNVIMNEKSRQSIAQKNKMFISSYMDKMNDNSLHKIINCLFEEGER
ncbi:MAG: hypothetical protein WBO70_05345 [Erysipelotrichaceae bacterium]